MTDRNQTTGKPMKVVTFRRHQGGDRIIIPADDDPGKHVRPELILKVQEINGMIETTRMTASEAIGFLNAFGERALEKMTRPSLTAQTPVSAMCHAGKDGECYWPDCPQARDSEPEKSGRFCPLPGWGDDDE